jgi:hypothetical protein
MTINPRPLDSVLKAIINVIPDDFENKATLKALFANIIDSANYTAPEAMFIRWEQAYNELTSYIPIKAGVILKPWEEIVVGIFSATLDYKKYL